MKKKLVNKKNKGLAAKLEKSVSAQSAGLYGHPEEFVRPLLQELEAQLAAPDIDLTSPENARASLEKLQVTSQKLEFYQDRVRKLKNVLLQRRFELTEK